MPATVMHIWVTKLLISPPWGVVRYADDAAAEAITDDRRATSQTRPWGHAADRRLGQCRPRRPRSQ